VYSIQKNLFGTTYVVEDDRAMQWEITSETADKHGFKCTKAISIYANEKGVETIVTAWFTASVPLQLGPVNYNGLPGLIVEISHMDNTYYLRRIEYTYVSIEDNRKGKTISIEEYNKLIQKSVGF
jgi:GLPGLI family protein